jgi:signal transduction histidine kinase/CheY-like chemotaxis protein/sugar lactone lactonase YvrE
MNPSIAQKETLTGQQLHFSHLTVEHGLSHNVGNDVVQDSQGFIWISTSDGLNWFDGYEIRTFRHDPDDPRSLSENLIRGMAVDPAGFIWIATAGGGLNKFDPRTETFVRYQHQPSNPNSLGFDFAVSVFVDQAGLVWVGGLGAVDRLDPETGTFCHYRHDPSDPTTIGPGQVHSICQEWGGTLWFGNRGGGGLSRLAGFPASTEGQQPLDSIGHFCHYRHDPSDPHSISDDSIQVVYIDQAGELWVGTENGGLNHFDRAAETFCRYRHDPQNPNSLSSDYVRDIIQDQAGHLWIATVRGLDQMDRAGGVFAHYRHNPADSVSISTDNLSRVYEDRAGGLWVTTFHGVDYCSPKHQRFRCYRHEPDNPNSLDDNSVRAVYEDASGILWVGTEKGLNKMDRSRGQITRYMQDPADPTSLSSGFFVSAIVEDAEHRLWVGTWGGELCCLDVQSERIWHPGDDPELPRIRDSLALCRDHNGDIWVGDYNQGLYRLISPAGTGRQDVALSSFVHYAHDPDDPHSLSANTVSVIYEDRDNVLWVGTETGGLNRFTGPAASTGDRTTETFARYCHDPQDPTSLSNNWVESILCDRAGNLWVGTHNGLNCLDRDTGTFRRYGERDGMPNATVVGILEDESCPDAKRTHLWLSTNQGLVKFDVWTETFQSYGAAEGIYPRSEINGYYKNSSGEMFFGGYGGLTAFYPDQIIDNQDLPPVVITNFVLFNKPVLIGGDSLLRQAIWATDEIALSDQDYSFAFEFAALSYVDPRKNRYKYRLEGFDQGWHEVDSRRRYATYANLTAGEYVFCVIGSNNHGVWNEEGARVKITVAQPLWEKLRLEKEAAEAANRAKSMFLANISHELRTPLNAILGFSQLMLQDSTLTAEQHRNLATIGRSGEHLLALINDVLELSKIEAGRMELHQADFDLCHLLLGLEEMFRLRAEDKGLSLLFDRASDVPRYIHTDENKLREVLINLLGNAVKFTEEGSVTLRVRTTDDRGRRTADEGAKEQPSFVAQGDRSSLVFEIEDTGPGISPDEMSAVFEPFAQTASGRLSRGGTGLGLPISRQYVQIMGGELTVSSELGRGCMFEFDLPVQVVDASRVQAVQLARRVTGMESGQRDATGAPYRVLIVEDVEVNRDLLGQLLGRLADIQVRQAVDGQEAIAIWEEWRPHLIWMDIRMPLVDGLEATRRIRAHYREDFRRPLHGGSCSPPVIIALTAHAFEEDRETIVAAGCDDFVRKPFREHEIYDALRRHLGIRLLYEDVTHAPEVAESVSLENLRAAVETLPAKWAADLYQATVDLDAEQMLALIETVRPQAPHLSDTLAQWVRDFQYEKMMALIAPDV